MECGIHICCPSRCNSFSLGTYKVQRLKALSADQQALAVKLYNEKQYTIAQICRMLEISKPTLYKYLADASAAGTTNP
ncbi:helix-turn-helix domain-containing protein [Herpetosiphon giganteus]|uniref:helix-turn-helix domain-containing protein n=1 Tax=Herpetosiphon giganteus TaxID=2029754 RepID=UPI0023BADA7F|nr:helix-turn-helix domain-containing protein [Herpetosiphon giganteus]